MGYEQMQNNRAYIAGRVISAPVFSHEVLGEKFFDMVVAVKRLSDHEDEIPVTVSDRLMRDASLDVGDAVGVSGQLRSYNKQAEGRSKLVLRVFARELDDGVCDTPNRIELEGYVCKPPVYRVTPFKREICDMLLAVNRAYNKSDYIPAIAWGRIPRKESPTRSPSRDWRGWTTRCENFFQAASRTPFFYATKFTNGRACCIIA